MSNTSEVNKWVSRLQRKLDSLPLTRLDREELEEMLAIIHNLSLRQVTGETDQLPVESASRRKKDEGGRS